MRDLLHRLRYSHMTLEKNNWGTMVFCHSRILGKFKKGTWFFGGFVFDLTHIDLHEFFLFTDPTTAAIWVEWENNR